MNLNDQPGGRSRQHEVPCKDPSALVRETWSAPEYKSPLPTWPSRLGGIFGIKPPPAMSRVDVKPEHVRVEPQLPSWEPLLQAMPLPETQQQFIKGESPPRMSHFDVKSEHVQIEPQSPSWESQLEAMSLPDTQQIFGDDDGFGWCSSPLSGYAGAFELPSLHFEPVFDDVAPTPRQTSIHIGRYDCTVPVQSYVDALEGHALSRDDATALLEANAFPPHAVRSIIGGVFGKKKAFASKTVRRRETALTRVEIEDKPPRRVREAFVGGSVEYRVGVRGEFNYVWDPKDPPPPRPTVVGPNVALQWRAYANWRGSLLLKSLGDEEDRGRRGTRFVNMNSAGQVLYLARSLPANRRQLQQLIDHASVYIEDWDIVKRKPKQVYLFEYIDSQCLPISLVVGDDTYSHLDQWLRDEQRFSKNKPLFRAGVQAFSRLLPAEDFSRLQAALLAKYPPSVPQTSTLRADAPEFVPQSLRVTYQGNGPSVTVKHQLEFEPQQVRAAVSDAVADASQEVIQQLARVYGPTAVKVMALVAALAVADSTAQIVAAFMQFTAGFPDAVARVASAAFQRLSGVSFTYQAGGGDPPEKDKGIELAAVQAFFHACWVEVASAFGVVRESSASLMGDIAYSMRFSVIKMTGASLAERLISYVAEFKNRLSACYEARSFQPLYAGGLDPGRFLRHCDGVCTNYTLLTNMVDPTHAKTQIRELVISDALPGCWTGPVSSGDWCRRALDMANDCIPLITAGPIGGLLAQARSRLIAMVNSVQSGAGAGRRPQPGFVYVWGPPGCGKTVAVFHLLRAYGMKHNLSPEFGGLSEFVPDANFQSQIKNSTWGIRLTDVDMKFMTAPTVVNNVEFTCRLVDSDPFEIEQAEAPAKGKVYCAPRIVVQSSNFGDSGAPNKIKEPSAFYRRITLRCRVEPRPEFAERNGSTFKLDEEKARAAGTHDVVLIHVDRWRNGQWTPVREQPFGISEWIQFTLETLDKWEQDQQTKFKLAAWDVDHCPRCYLPSDLRCGCVQYQGGAVSRAREATFNATGLMIGRHPVGTEIPVTPSEAAAQAAAPAWWASVRARYDELLDSVYYDAVPTLAKVVGVLSLTTLLFTLYQKRPQARVGNASDVPAGWQRAATAIPISALAPPPTAHTREDMMRWLDCAHCTVLNLRDNQQVHGWIVSTMAVLTVSHIARKGDRVRVTFSYSQPPVSCEVVWDDQSVAKLANPEACLLRVTNAPGVPDGIRFMLPALPMNLGSLDELVIWSPERSYATASNTVSTTNQGTVIYADAPTVAGDCGSVYLGRFNSGWRLYGLHFAKVDFRSAFSEVSRATAAVFTSDDIVRRISGQFKVFPQGTVVVNSTFSRGPSPKTYPFSARSSVWAAVTTGKPLFLMGALDPPLAGVTPKSKIEKSILFDEILAAFPEVKEGDFAPPRFKGEMRGDAYWSPMIENIQSVNRTEPTHLDIVAVWDYLCGARELDREGYRSLSTEEAIKGIPRSALHGVNMQTAIGPPYMGPKSDWFAITDSGEVYIEPRIRAQLDEIVAASRQGIPQVMAVQTLKDEVLKAGKTARSFFNLPAACNIFIKERLGPLRAFLGDNPFFFECLVGINMTNTAEVARVVRFLESFGKRGKKYDLDGRTVDTKVTGMAFYMGAVTHGYLAAGLGLQPEDVQQAMLTVFYAATNVNNDLVQLLRNLSGWDFTVQINSLTMSLSERKVWYAQHPEFLDYALPLALEWWAREGWELPVGRSLYRECNALLTYGDDMVLSSLHSRVGIEALWLELCGIEVTDGAKKPTIEPKALEELVLLKRHFRWDEELRTYLPPLDLRSIVKMLLFKKTRTLSHVDHMADMLTAAAKELVYHGEEAFARLEPLVQAFKARYGPNRYLDDRPYAYWRARIAEGVFTTWRMDTPPQLTGGIMVDGDATAECVVTYQSSKMTDVDVKSSNGPAPVSTHETSMRTAVSHDVGTMDSASTQVTVAPVAVPQFFQSMPESNLGEVLARPVKIAHYSISDMDADTEEIASFDPWALFLADPVVADKVAQFHYIRGTVQLTFVLSTPGNAYGAYVATAYPNVRAPGDSSVPSIRTDRDIPAAVENCYQLDHYARLDCASSNNVVMQLPFLYPTDLMRIASPGTMWKVRLICLAGMRSGQVTGNPTGTITVYANLVDDMILTLPNYQSGHAHKHARDHVRSAMSAASGLHTALVPTPGSPAATTAVSARVDAAAAAVDKLSGVPVIGPYAHTAAKVAGTVGKALKFLGFTRNHMVPEPSTDILRSVTNVACTDALDSSDIAAMTSDNAISIDPTMAGGVPEDVLSYESLFARWTLVRDFEWNATDAHGTNLASIPVTPMISRGSESSLRLTTAGWVGYPFRYWRGDMEYLVVTPVSRLHRGSLQAFFIPAGSTAAGTTDPTNRTFNHVWEVAAGEDKHLTIGYTHREPVLETRIVAGDTAIVGPGTTGTLVFRVVNPIKSQNGVDAPRVRVLIFARAASNMRFWVPRALRDVTSAITPLPYELITSVRYQGGATGDELNPEALPVALVPPSGDYPASDLLFGETISSLRALMQKPSYVPTTGGSYSSAIWNYPLPQLGYVWWNGTAKPAEQRAQVWTWAGHCRVLFVGIAASERYKVFPTTDCWLGAAATDVSGLAAPSNGPNLPATLAPMVYSGPMRAGEFLIPYAAPLKFLPADRNQVDGLTRSNVVYARMPKDKVVSGVDLDLNLYWCYGPDIRVVGFAGVPTLTPVPSAPKLGWLDGNP